jgi:BexC/CtrB/KpsE family polysaccharide export inner-membrane protein
LSIDQDFPRSVIDRFGFARALDRGALDDCLDLLRQENRNNPDAARLNCQLAEALFHSGRCDEALECGRRAFAFAGSEDAVAHCCAWLFSNCGVYAEAVEAYKRLLDRYPDWVEGYRHLSGSLAATGDSSGAIACAVRASDLEPANSDYALHAGCLLLDAERIEEATIYITRAIDIEPNNPYALRALSAAGYALDRRDEAVHLALQAALLAPSDSDIAIHAAELLLRAGQVIDALTLLREATRHGSANSALWRLISAAEVQRDELDRALEAIERALDLSPDHAEYHLHYGHLLYRLGDFAAAAKAFNRAAELDPANHAVWRAQIDMLLAEDRVTDATALGGELLRAFPEDDNSAETVLHVLNRRLDTIDGDYVIIGERSRRLPEQPRPFPTFVERLKTQFRVVHALIIRETRTRFGDSRLGYGWALIEPILHIALLSWVFSLLMHGNPPIGTHFFIFYFTGLIPYYIFIHTSTSMTHAVTGNGSLLQLPLVTPFEELVRYWNGQVDPFYDGSTGTIVVRLRAFAPADALRLARALVATSEKLVNDLSARARHDALGHAEADLASAEARLATALDNIREFRNKSGLIDPGKTADATAQLANKLRDDLIKANSQLATLKTFMRDDAPPVRVLKARIRSLETQEHGLAQELTSTSQPATPALSQTLGSYDVLEAEHKFAETAYQHALETLDKARVIADRQQIYIASFVPPSLPEEALYPHRWRSLGVICLVAFAVWAIGALAVQSVRDHL